MPLLRSPTVPTQEGRFRKAGAGRLALPVVLASLALPIALFPGAAARLEYHRQSILQGELWRLLTGHWTHGSTEHLVWDVLAFIALGVPLALASFRLFWSTLIASAVAISAYLLVLAPEWERYRGLSGIDSALFAALAAAWIIRGSKPEKILAGLGLGAFALKIAYELVLGTGLFVSPIAGYDVLPAAHAVGAATGVACAMIDRRRRRLAGEVEN